MDLGLSRPFAGAFAALSQAAIALALAGCGGGDDSSTVAAVPSWPADAQIAGTLQGSMVCAAGSFEYQPYPDGTRRLTSMSTLGVPKIDNFVSVAYRGVDGFQLDINGFGGDTFGSLDQREAVFRDTWYFVQGSSEFEIGSASLGDASLGRYSDGTSLCFFAVGSVRRPLLFQVSPSQPSQFSGFADGIAWVGGAARRLYRDSGVSGTIDYDRGQIELTLELTGRASPFQKLQNPVTLGIASGRLSIAPTGAISGVLTGPEGSTGTVSGGLFEYGLGLGLIFELSYPNGDRIYGAIAADTLQI
jgi:hypothetical protein